MDDSFLPFAANIGGRQNPIREKPGLSLFLLTWAAEQNSCELLQDANRCPAHVPLPCTNGAFVTIVPRIVSHSSTVMSEWSIEHAWKTISARLTKQYRNTSCAFGSTTSRHKMLLDVIP